MAYRVDQFAAVHVRKEGELYVDWDKIRKFANSGSKKEMQLALALLAMGRRVEELEEKLMPKVKEAAQEPVAASREEIRQAVREVAQKVCGND